MKLLYLQKPLVPSHSQKLLDGPSTNDTVYSSVSQEVYWRIPPTMTPSQLTAAASALRPSSVEEEEEGVRSEGEEDDMGGEGASSPARSGVKTKTGSVLDSDDSEEGMNIEIVESRFCYRE